MFLKIGIHNLRKWVLHHCLEKENENDKSKFIILTNALMRIRIFKGNRFLT